MAMDSMKGKCASSWVDLGYTNFFAFLRWHLCSSLVVTVFLGILFSSIREIKIPYVFDWEHGTPQQEMQGNRASPCGEGEVSWVFSSCSTHLVYILELRRGWPFEIRVSSAKSGLLSSYDGHLGKLNYTWQENTDASACEPGGKASLIIWHSYFGIPINFHEESGIVPFWSIELMQISKSQMDVRPSVQKPLRSMAFSRVSTGDSHIPSSCEMKDELAFKALHLKPAFFWVRASRGPFYWRQKTQSRSHIPISKGNLLLRCLWKAAFLFSRRQGIILIPRRYGVHGSFLKLL